MAYQNPWLVLRLRFNRVWYGKDEIRDVTSGWVKSRDMRSNSNQHPIITVSFQIRACLDLRIGILIEGSRRMCGQLLAILIF